MAATSEDDRLCENVNVSRSWFEKTMGDKFATKVQVIKAEPMSDIDGYMSSIVRVQLKWNEDRDELPKNVVAKIPAMAVVKEAWQASIAEGEKIPEQGKVTVHELMHTLEINTYTELNKQEIPGLSIPRMYFSQPFHSEVPILVMDDMSPCSTVDLIDGFTEKQMYAIVDQLVALHVHCYTHDGWKTIDDQFVNERKLTTNYMEMQLRITEKIAKDVEVLRKPLNLLIKHLLSDPEWLIRYYDSYKQERKLRVFTHADMWTSQILWRGDELVAIVDWALVGPGSLTNDFLRTIVTCCSVENRKKWTLPLLEHYYSTIKSRFDQLRLPVPFTFEELLADYKETLGYTSALTSFATGMWSNSKVLLKGRSGEEDRMRVEEMQRRLLAIVEETIEAYHWK